VILDISCLGYNTFVNGFKSLLVILNSIAYYVMFFSFSYVYVGFHYTWCLCFVLYVLGLDSYVVVNELVLNHQKCFFFFFFFGVAIIFNGLNIILCFIFFTVYKLCLQSFIQAGNHKCSQLGLKNLRKHFWSFFGWFSFTLCEVLNPIRGLVTPKHGEKTW
jgi:hypothetical protein